MKRTSRVLFISFACVVVFIGLLFIFQSQPHLSNQLTEVTTTDVAMEQEFHLITGEFKTTTEAGEEIEAYRFSPGQLTLFKGKPVTLHLHGVNGNFHTFEIKEFDVQGTIKKGETTTVTFTPDRTGTFELVCTNHRDFEHNGPMIAYLTVIE